MKRIALAIPMLMVIAAGGTFRLAAQAPPPPAPRIVTFNKDVAPILYANCTTCHRPGEIAPMSLLTYKDARPWVRSMRDYVARRQMPPWHADPSIGHFSNTRRLSDEEVNTIVQWVNTGAREGDPADLPHAPTYADGWNIGTPDVVLKMREPFTVPAEGVVEYQYFEVPTNFTEDRWVRAIEVRPGNRAVVHHVIVFMHEPDPPPGAPKRAKQFEFPAEQMLTEAQEAREKELEKQGLAPKRKVTGMLVGTAVGTAPEILPAGAAKLVKAGTVLTFQMHYTTNGTEANDQTSIGLIFAKEKPEHEVRTSAWMNRQFVIPAGSSGHRVDATLGVLEDTTFWSLLPHTHLRGKAFEYTVTYPDGRKQVVLRVPKYDFNWQTDYRFAEPLALPKGSTITASAWYDNSASNPSNPDPSAEVRWGDQTWEEMQFTGFTYTVPPPRQPAPTSAAARADGER